MFVQTKGVSRDGIKNFLLLLIVSVLIIGFIAITQSAVYANNDKQIYLDYLTSEKWKSEGEQYPLDNNAAISSTCMVDLDGDGTYELLTSSELDEAYNSATYTKFFTIQNGEVKEIISAVRLQSSGTPGNTDSITFMYDKSSQRHVLAVTYRQNAWGLYGDGLIIYDYNDGIATEKISMSNVADNGALDKKEYFINESQVTKEEYDLNRNNYSDTTDSAYMLVDTVGNNPIPAAPTKNPANVTYLEDLTPINSDRYTGNMGDSYIGVLVDYLEKYYSDHEVSKDTYNHGLVSWIARWNYRDEISWIWNEYNIDGKYDSLLGDIVIIKSYNSDNFDTKIEIIGDGKVLYSNDLEFVKLPIKNLNIDVGGIKTLRISLKDNVAKPGGTAFGLVDFRLTKEPAPNLINDKNFYVEVGNFIRNNALLLYSPVIDDKQYHLYQIENKKISFSNDRFSLITVPSEVHSYLLDSSFSIVIDPNVLIKAIYLDVANLAVRDGQKDKTMSFLKESRQRLTDMEDLTQKAMRLYNLGSGLAGLSDYVMTIARLVVGDITAIVDFGVDKATDGMIGIAEKSSYTFTVENYLRGHALAYNQDSIRQLTSAINMLENQASYNNGYIKNYNDAVLLDTSRTLMEIYLEYFWMDMKYFQTKVERTKREAFRKMFFTTLDGLGAPDFMDFSAITDVNITITSLIADGLAIVTTDISTLTDPDLIKMERKIKTIKQAFAESLYPMYNADVFGNVELLAVMNREFQTTSTWAADAVNEAVMLGIVPADIQQEYRRAISRSETADMFLRVLQAANATSIEAILFDKGLLPDTAKFTDTNNIRVFQAEALGIISGVGNTRFDPNGELTRAQAATIIMNTARAFGIDTSGYSSNFIDDVPPWSNDAIGFCQHFGIVGGVGDSSFDPNAVFTREQAIVTAVELFHFLNEKP